MKKDYAAKQFNRMVVIGESHVAGASATKREYSWAEILRGLINEFQDTEVEFFNVGLGADILTPKSPAYEPLYKGIRPVGMERYKKHVIEKNPDLVVIAYGYNDIRAGTRFEDFICDYEKMVVDIKENTHSAIVLCTPYFIPERGYRHKSGGTHVGDLWNNGNSELHRRYIEGILGLAAKLEVITADIYTAMNSAPWIICDAEECTDLHANDLGHRIVGNKVFEAIATNCSCLAQKARRERIETGKSPWRYDSNAKENDLIKDFYPNYVKAKK